MLPDQQQQAVAAVEVAAVEAGVRPMRMLCDGLHRRARGLVADGGTPVGQELDQLGPADDGRARHQVVLVELALLETGRADVHGAAPLGEVVHQLLEGGEALLVDAVGESLLGQADALDAEEHERLLAGTEGGVGDHEGHRGLVRIVLGVGEADAELVGHGSRLLSTDVVHGMARLDQRMPGEPTPGGQVGGRAGVTGGQLENLAGLHALESHAELEDQLTAAEVACVPTIINHGGFQLHPPYPPLGGPRGTRGPPRHYLGGRGV